MNASLVLLLFDTPVVTALTGAVLDRLVDTVAINCKRALASGSEGNVNAVMPPEELVSLLLYITEQKLSGTRICKKDKNNLKCNEL